MRVTEIIVPKRNSRSTRYAVIGVLCGLLAGFLIGRGTVPAESDSARTAAQPVRTRDQRHDREKRLSALEREKEQLLERCRAAESEYLQAHQRLEALKASKPTVHEDRDALSLARPMMGATFKTYEESPKVIQVAIRTWLGGATPEERGFLPAAYHVSDSGIHYQRMNPPESNLDDELRAVATVQLEMWAKLSAIEDAFVADVLSKESAATLTTYPTNHAALEAAKILGGSGVARVVESESGFVVVDLRPLLRDRIDYRLYQGLYGLAESELDVRRVESELGVQSWDAIDRVEPY